MMLIDYLKLVGGTSFLDIFKRRLISTLERVLFLNLFISWA